MRKVVTVEAMHKFDAGPPLLLRGVYRNGRLEDYETYDTSIPGRLYPVDWKLSDSQEAKVIEVLSRAYYKAIAKK